MTPAQRRTLANLAGAIALEAPFRRSKYSPTTYVSWQVVEEIRAVLEEAGIDWRKMARELRQAATERARGAELDR
jgi:hypothetical protein